MVRFRKRIILGILLVFSVGACACSKRQKEKAFYTGGSEKHANVTLEAIIAAAESNNKTALKDLFSETALEQADDIDMELAAFIEFYQGKMKSYKKQALQSNQSSGYGEGEKDYLFQVAALYKVETDQNIYHIRFSENVESKNDKDAGVYRIGIITDEVFQTRHNEFGTTDCGLYIIQ